MKPSLLERALDMLDYGLLIIDGRGRLEYKNRAAGVLLKSTASPLVVSSGSIRGRSKSLRFELRQAIARVCATRRLSALAAPQAGPMPLRMVLTPIALRNSVGAAIWMVNVQPQMLPDERTLCLLFGLSR